MINHHVNSLCHNQKLIDKKVIVYTKENLTVGILEKVEQVVYGIKPTYIVIVDENPVKTQGVLVPFSLTTEHDLKVSPELATENFIFEPFCFNDY